MKNKATRLGCIRKIVLPCALLHLCNLAQASNIITIANNSQPVNGIAAGPVIVLKSFDNSRGVGDIQYLLNPEPMSYKLEKKNSFNAYSSFHTLSSAVGHSLVASHAIKVGNINANGQSNFKIQLLGREGKTKIGPLSCVDNSEQLCYEIPTTELTINVNGKDYSPLTNDGQLSLPAGNNYKVSLGVKVTTAEVLVHSPLAAKQNSKQTNVPVSNAANF